MALWRHITRGIQGLLNRRTAEQDVADELQHYLDEATSQLIAEGLSPDAARLTIRRRIGNPQVIQEEVRDYGWEHVVITLAADVRFAVRMLRKSPLFTIVVVLVIALGSGAVTTIFSAMNALVLRPLPGVADADTLVGIEPTRPDGEVLQQGSYALYDYLRQRTHSLDGIAAWGKVSLTISAGDEGAAVWGNMVSGNFFDVLRVRPALGRFFAPEEARTPLSHPVIVVSSAFWKSHLGADASVVGKRLLVNGRPFTLIGIAPETFRGIYTGVRADAWVPLMMQPALRPRADLADSSWLWLFGRLPGGTALEAAQRELPVLASARAAETGQARGPAGYASVRVVALTGLPGGEAGQMRGFLAILLAAATAVLLIAGVNVAAMLSARSLAHRREFAVRAALGAGRLRLVRQLLTEILLLFLAGAIAGFALAVAATSALEQISLPVSLPIMLELSPDLRVFAFALAISLLTGLAFGLAPALQAARRDITSRLRDDAPAGGSRRSFMNRTLVVGQLALSLTLLVAAALFVRALANGQRIDPGFDLDGVTTASFETESLGYTEARSRAFYSALRERLEAIPGIANVSYSGRLPLTGGSSSEDVDVDGRIMSIHNARVDSGYFATLRIPVLQGRTFASSDDERAAAVAVVNETFARRGWPDGTALGRSFRFNNTPVTVIGVVRDARYATLGETTPPFAYVRLAQFWQPSQALLVRSGLPLEQVATAVQQAARSIDSTVPRPQVSTLRSATSIVLLPQRVAAMITGVLGAVGLLLAAVGLYGIMAYSANRRTREMGIRVALGARRGDVLGMMMQEGVRLASLGIVIGLLLAALVTPLMTQFLFNVSPLDAGAYAGMGVLFVTVALAASYVPARRAAASDPLAALRAD
jgi:predicted permease